MRTFSQAMLKHSVSFRLSIRNLLVILHGKIVFSAILQNFHQQKYRSTNTSNSTISTITTIIIITITTIRLPLLLLLLRLLLLLYYYQFLRGQMSESWLAKLPTVSFHNFKSQNFKLSVSNPKSKYVAYLSVLSQISNCQSLGRKNKHEHFKTDRRFGCPRG